MNEKDIKLRLDELDRMESQILFSASFLSEEDHNRLDEIHKEQRELKERLKAITE